MSDEIQNLANPTEESAPTAEDSRPEETVMENTEGPIPASEPEQETAETEIPVAETETQPKSEPVPSKWEKSPYAEASLEKEAKKKAKEEKKQQKKEERRRKYEARAAKKEEKKRLKTDRLLEVRRLLSGMVTYENGYIFAAPRLNRVQFYGSMNGATAARFLGVSTYMRQYKINGKVQRLAEVAQKKLGEIGKEAYLFTAPEATCIFRRRGFLNPVIMSLDVEKDQMLVTLYIAKTLFGKLAEKSMFKKFEKDLPGQFVPVERTMEPFSLTFKELEEQRKAEEQQETVTK